MSTDPSFEGLPAEVITAHTEGLSQLAERENQREPTIPTHYATSLSELRGLQRQPTSAPQPVAPSVNVPPLNIELIGDLEEVTTVTELCERAGAILSSIAEQLNHVQLESVARRLQSVHVHAQGELSVKYAKEHRQLGRSWNAIAEDLNELMKTRPVYKPLRSSAWNGRSLKSLVHLRSREND